MNQKVLGHFVWGKDKLSPLQNSSAFLSRHRLTTMNFEK